MRALSHPERRLFVRACKDQAKAAGELASLCALSLATVSEHLKVLRKSRLLVLEKRGRFWLYRTDPAVLRHVINALGELQDD